MTLEPEPTAYPEPASTPRPVPGGTNGFPLAVASLVLGIVGLTAFPVIPSVLALVFGYRARREIDRAGGTQEGRGVAVAGIVLGWIGCVVLLLIIAALALNILAVYRFGDF